MCNRPLPPHPLCHTKKKSVQRLLRDAVFLGKLISQPSSQRFSRPAQLFRSDIRNGRSVCLQRVAEMRSVAQIDEILPAETNLHVFQEAIVIYGDPFFNHVAIATTPFLRLRNETGGELIRPKLLKKAGGHHFNDLVECHSASLGCRDFIEQGLLEDGERVAGLGDGCAVRRVLHRIRKHQKARLGLGILLVVTGGVKSPGDSGSERDRPQAEQQKPRGMATDGTGPIYLALLIGRIVHPDRRLGTGFERVVIGLSEMDGVGVQESLHDHLAASSADGLSVDGIVVEEADPVAVLVVEEFLVDLFKRSPDRGGPGMQATDMGRGAASIAIHDWQDLLQPAGVEINPVMQLDL